MHNPKIAIILINYNNSQDTIECVESLLRGNYPNQTIIIIDNCSSDNSYDILIQAFPNLAVYKTESNLGFSGGNNFGIELARKEQPEYICLLNNDTLVEPDAISKLLERMEANPQFGMASGLIKQHPDTKKIWYAGGHLIPWRGLAVHDHFGMEIMENSKLEEREVDFMSGCYLCISTKALQTTGLLNDQFFMYLEDIEFCARAVKRGIRLLFVPQSVIYHKWRGETKTSVRTLYYSVRNRRLLIKLAFPFYAMWQYEIIVRLKLLMWFFTDKELYKSAMRGFTDFKNNYFGPY